jgi:hypothetical protein
MLYKRDTIVIPPPDLRTRSHGLQPVKTGIFSSYRIENTRNTASIPAIFALSDEKILVSMAFPPDENRL